MADDQEIKCIIALIHALGNKSDKSSNINEIDFNSRNARDSSREDREDESRNQEMQKQQSPIALPDAVIRDGILSYRPFRPFRVVLIRGDNEEITWNNRNYQNFGGGGSSLRQKREYSLTFGSNRGLLRFRVVELPYLPPENHSNRAEADIYNTADGVIISCYISRFFEYCDRYGYHYASSSILEDVTKRRIERKVNYISQDSDDEILPYHDRKRARTARQRNDYPMSIVLCANNVDVTHVDARLSSIVFRESIIRPRTKSAGTMSSASETGAFEKPITSFIENPRHPFSSLARCLTSDNGLEFIDVTANINTGKDEMEERMRNAETKISGLSSDFHGLMPAQDQQQQQRRKKFTWSNDDDIRSWSWLRAQISS